MTRGRLAGIVCLLTLVVAPSVAIAEQAADQGGRAQGRVARPNARARVGVAPPRPANPEMMTARQVEQYFDQVVLFQAQTRLELTDAQFLRFGSALRQLQDARRTQQRRRAEILRQIDVLLAAPESDEAAVSARIKEIDDLNAESARRIQDAYAAVDGVLTLRQRARFRVFEEMMERRKLDLLARARQQTSGPAARGRQSAAPSQPQ